MVSLLKEYHDLSDYITRNRVLQTLWAHFGSTLTEEHKKYILAYTQNPDEMLLPTFKLTRKQMELYRLLYDQLPKKYKQVAGRTIGIPFEIDESFQDGSFLDEFVREAVKTLKSCSIGKPPFDPLGYTKLQTPEDVRITLKYLLFDLQARQVDSNKEKK